MYKFVLLKPSIQDTSKYKYNIQEKNTQDTIYTRYKIHKIQDTQDTGYKIQDI